MLTVSLHGIRITAPIGLYPEEKINPNTFEVDADLFFDAPVMQQWPFADYTLINSTVTEVFALPLELLEELVQQIHAALKLQFADAVKIKVTVRKLNPPMPGNVQYAQVSYEA
jgi:dihydroneopterin aldolase